MAPLDMVMVVQVWRDMELLTDTHQLVVVELVKPPLRLLILPVPMDEGGPPGGPRVASIGAIVPTNLTESSHDTFLHSCGVSRLSSIGRMCVISL